MSTIESLELGPRTSQLARYLAAFATRVVASDTDPQGDTRVAALGLDNTVADALVTEQLRNLVNSRPALLQRVQRLGNSLGPPDDASTLQAIEKQLTGALRARPELVDALWPLLAPLTAPTDPFEGAPPDRDHRFGRHFAAAMLITGVVVAVVVVGAFAADKQLGDLSPVELISIWVLSFLPGWLYIRFIGQRAEALWDDYVLNLHRLGLDEPQFLPQPPVNSVYFQAWLAGGGATLSRHRNIYRQKFDAYYGRSVSATTRSSRVKTDTFLPVVLATIAFAVGWTALLWNHELPQPLNNAAPDSVADVLGFGFLGAYLFSVQMLSRRFFQSDLKPSAYTSAVLRVVIVLIIVFVLHQLPVFDNAAEGEAVVAFVVGLFPLVGLQALNRLVAVVLKSSVPSLQSDYPLSDLDGLNVWYEARLLEEGIEDMQNLVSANTVDVILHTRVPVGRLVDWCDQANLYLHLDPRASARSRKKDGREGDARDALNSLGIRRATSFLTTFPPETIDDNGEFTDPVARDAVAACDGSALRPAAIAVIARILGNERGLNYIRNWRSWQRDDDAKTGVEASAPSTDASSGAPREQLKPAA